MSEWVGKPRPDDVVPKEFWVKDLRIFPRTKSRPCISCCLSTAPSSIASGRSGRLFDKNHEFPTSSGYVNNQIDRFWGD